MNLFVYELICAGGLARPTPPSLREEGWAMLAALVDDFDRIEGVTTCTLLDRSLPRALGRVCKRVGLGEEHAGFHEVIAQADLVLVVAPEFDQFLLERCRWVLDAGRSLLGSRLDAISLTGDKFALARHFAKCGIRSPLTKLHRGNGCPGLDECTYPAVCKPRDGAGSQATFLVPSKDEFARIWAQARAELPASEFVMQPFVSGQAVSVVFLVGPRQSVALPPAAQELSADGRFHYQGGQLPLPGPLAERAVALGCQAIASVIGLAGFIGVDLILGEAADGSEDWVIEINPRPTTSYIGLRQLALDNLAEATLRIAHGEAIMPLRWRDGDVRFHV